MTDAASTLTEALAFHQGDWMKKALDFAGVPAKRMAEYLDVDPATVSRWINGKQPASKQTLRLWALRTGVPLRYLETGIINDESPRPEGPDRGNTAETTRPAGETSLYHLRRPVSLIERLAA